MLARYHVNGDVNDELVLFEFSEIRQAISYERSAANSTGFLSFFESRGNRHRLLICVLVGFMIQWAGNGIVSYYLAPILESVGVTSAVSQATINVSLQVWNALLAAAGAVAAERYGRRPLSVAYIVEILSFRLRSKGLSINLTVVFGAAFFNQYVNPVALGAIHWKFYFVYIGTLRG
ncbi:hypothetical protein PMIN06_007377 [Paraphaeosphaeria minitans]